VTARRWWRNLTGHHEIARGSELHRSRTLVTESRLRTDLTGKLIEAVNEENRLDLADALARIAGRMADGPNPLLGERPGAAGDPR
jgi:hypothetical protein